MALKTYTNFTTAISIYSFLAVLISGINALNLVNNLEDFNATDLIQAEYTLPGHFNIYNDCSIPEDVTYVGSIYSNTVLRYPRVNFGSGVETITLRVFNYSGNYVVYVAVHLGLDSNPPVAVVPVGKTGDYCGWYTITAFLDTYLSSYQDLFLTFPSTMGQGFLGIDWFYFNQTVY